MPTARFDDRYSQAEAGTPVGPRPSRSLLDAELDLVDHGPPRRATARATPT